MSSLNYNINATAEAELAVVEEDDPRETPGSDALGG